MEGAMNSCKVQPRVDHVLSAKLLSSDIDVLDRLKRYA
jgi:hypothetical protein